MTQLLKNSLQRHARRAATTYASCAVVDTEIAKRLDERLLLIKPTPERILICHARAGASAELLRARYPTAALIACDFAEALLSQAMTGASNAKFNAHVAEYTELPVRTRSVDLVFANLALAWVSDLERVLQEFYRVLRPKGLLMFTSFGPDTLREIQQLSATPRVHPFYDMHDLGDLLLAQHFADPVMDMEQLTVRYPDAVALCHELKALGATNARADQARGLQGKVAWRRLIQQYNAQFVMQGGGVSATVEVVYGHAWLPEAPEVRPMGIQGEAVVPLSALTRK